MPSICRADLCVYFCYDSLNSHMHCYCTFGATYSVQAATHVCDLLSMRLSASMLDPFQKQLLIIICIVCVVFNFLNVLSRKPNANAVHVQRRQYKHNSNKWTTSSLTHETATATQMPTKTMCLCTRLAGGIPKSSTEKTESVSPLTCHLLCVRVSTHKLTTVYGLTKMIIIIILRNYSCTLHWFCVSLSSRTDLTAFEMLLNCVSVTLKQSKCQ